MVCCFFSRAVRPRTFIYQGPEIWCNRNPGTLIANCDRKSLHDTNENEMHAVLGYPTVGLRVRVTCVSISVHILVLTCNGLTSISPSSPLNMIDGVDQLLPWCIIVASNGSIVESDRTIDNIMNEKWR